MAEKEKEDLQNEWNLYETNVSLLDFIFQTSNLKDFERKIDNILPKDWPIYEKTPKFFRKYNPLSINQKDKEKRTFLKMFQSTPPNLIPLLDDTLGDPTVIPTSTGKKKRKKKQKKIPESEEDIINTLKGKTKL